MFERFTDRARRVVVLAQEESRHRGHRVIDVGHIALGALTASEGAGLGGDTVDALRRAIDTTLAGRAVELGYAGRLRTAIAAGRATDPGDTEQSESAARVVSMPTDNSETIIALLHQVLQRLDTIAERLERDT